MQGYTNASAAATIRLVNQSATFSTQSTPDYAAYPCRAAIAITGCTTLKQATATYNPTEAASGNYAPFCETYNGGVYLYSKVAGTITVAAIVLEGVSNFYNMEATPTENSGNPITSGGVYTNCVRTSGNQEISDVKTFTSNTIHTQPILLNANNTDPYIMLTSNYPRICGKNLNNLASADGMLYQTFGYDSADFRWYQMDVYRRGTAGLTELHHYIINKNGNWNEMNLIIDDNNNAWACAPYRTYVKTNTSDIMTIGHLNSAIEIDGTKYFTDTTTSPNHNLRNASLVQSGNSSVGGMTLNFLGRNSANTGDISRAYIQFYHAPGSNSASSTNLLYLRAYKDDCTNYVDLSMDATNNYVSTNGTMSMTGLRVGGQQVVQLYNDAWNNGSIGGWGILTAANGYTHVAAIYRNDGAVTIAEKSNAISMQLDGWFYQNEGRYRCLDTSDASLAPAGSSQELRIMTTNYFQVNSTIIWSGDVTTTQTAVNFPTNKAWYHYNYLEIIYYYSSYLGVFTVPMYSLVMNAGKTVMYSIATGSVSNMWIYFTKVSDTQIKINTNATDVHITSVVAW